MSTEPKKTDPDFESSVTEMIVEELREMPSLWQGDEGSDNAWEMLVHLWPDDEPGMGVWDEIRSVVVDWAESVVARQPRETVQEYWEEETEQGQEFRWKREEAESQDDASNPEMELMSADVANRLLQEVLNLAERESLDREDAAMEREAAWEEPSEWIETLTSFLRAQASAYWMEPRNLVTVAQWLHVCASIPNSWPAAIPGLKLRETGGGDAWLRLSYDGEQLRIDAADACKTEFGKEPPWENVTTITEDGADGDAGESIALIDDALRNESPRGFNLIFDQPARDIPDSFWD